MSFYCVWLHPRGGAILLGGACTPICVDIGPPHLLAQLRRALRANAPSTVHVPIQNAKRKLLATSAL